MLSRTRGACIYIEPCKPSNPSNSWGVARNLLEFGDSIAKTPWTMYFCEEVCELIKRLNGMKL
jgi:hypothetical protein